MTVHRLWPDMPPERESIGFEKLALIRRVSSLARRVDIAEANGWDAAPMRAEIGRCVRAIHFIDQLLGVQGGTAA